MRIDINSLKDIKYVSFALENCEGFDIEAKHIVDIWFDEIHKGVGPNKKMKFMTVDLYCRRSALTY